MSTEFVQTGQTFTNEGAAFCPVERKRRGPLALAASLAVLVSGAGFLSYTMMSAPAPVSDPGTEASVQPADGLPIIELHAAAAAAPANIEEPKLSLAEALAESRAARAETAPLSQPFQPASLPASKGGLAPRVKPNRGGVVIDPGKDIMVEVELAPRIKPMGEVKFIAPPVRAQPAKMGAAQHAAPAFTLTSVFFESDLRHNEAWQYPAAVYYAGDMERGFTEAYIRIVKGENFVDALKRAGIGAADRNEAAYAFGKHYNLRRLRPGQTFTLTLGWPNQTLFQLAASGKKPKARLIALEFRADPENRIIVRRDAAGKLAGDKAPVALTTRVLSIAGRIDGSLYMSAKAAGAPDQIIADLADAFAYDVDFQREIFGGDEFEAIFEARYDDQGDLVSTGDIVYARLNWRGRSREKGYYRFASKADGERGDYYDASGQGAKRLLMKTPIDGARLSSRFGTRKHPILGYRKAHKGVDFAARRGTPIKAAGDGVVERANRYGSFGNYIRIRHANGYKTAYAHLKGFRRGIRAGKRVRQGDIIAYVGTTGRSTGPHLHYEVHLNGKAVNPQKLKIATGKQLKGADLDRFRAQRDMINAMRLPPEDQAALFAKDDAAAKNAL